ncbi:hypothetical protein BDQ12DRAFT_653060 [Crucibulum laeve]|uniref:BTB domain-containing protein n=1 Tax=Crucibulum laeve TaxID=68775 RepID=A0A5C3LYG4_9AGAR|nr:hypothetical protein BDQ12DRAFT_653060 [Crucibulum laeve]
MCMLCHNARHSVHALSSYFLPTYFIIIHIKMSSVRTSENFNASDADVIIQSCDGVQFHIHRKHLEANTGAFPPAEFSTKGEVVKLTENVRTLNFLFQFIYPKRHPALDSEKFDVLAPLAEAAEKYEVFSAINICHIRMIAFVSTFPREVMVYACRHDYPQVMDRVALFVIRYPLDTTVALLPPRFVVPWVIVLPSRNIKKVTDILLVDPLLSALVECIASGRWLPNDTDYSQYNKGPQYSQYRRYRILVFIQFCANV